ncbi:MAG: tetratricopeptide repeat protein [Polyangiaceae bacterium]
MLALLGVACGSDPSKRLQTARQTSREEQTDDKLIERGKAFAQLGDYTRATQYFERALENGADPKVVLPLLMRAYVESNSYRLAIQVGERQLAKQPQDHALRFLLATLYSAIGDTDSAREHLRQVVRENPSNQEAHYVLAVLLRDKDHDYLGAHQHFSEYLRLSPDGPHADEARGSLLKTVP